AELLGEAALERPELLDDLLELGEGLLQHLVLGAEGLLVGDAVDARDRVRVPREVSRERVVGGERELRELDAAVVGLARLVGDLRLLGRERLRGRARSGRRRARFLLLAGVALEPGDLLPGRRRGLLRRRRRPRAAAPALAGVAAPRAASAAVIRVAARSPAVAALVGRAARSAPAVAALVGRAAIPDVARASGAPVAFADPVAVGRRA